MWTRGLITSLSAACFVGMSALPAAASVVLLNTDFDSATTGTYSNGSVINSSGAATSQLTVATATDESLQIVNVGGSNQAVQLIDNSATANNAPSMTKSISGISTTSSGNDYIRGGFDFVYLATGSSASLPQMQFLISNGGGAGSTTSDIQLLIRGGAGGFSPTSGTSAAIVSGDTYHLDLALDLSSGTQDTWSYSLTDVTAGTAAVAQTLNTRAPNITPNSIAFYGGVNGTPLNASPYIQIDNVSFSALNVTEVPEPTAIALLSPVAWAAVSRRRNRRVR